MTLEEFRTRWTEPVLLAILRNDRRTFELMRRVGTWEEAVGDLAQVSPAVIYLRKEEPRVRLTERGKEMLTELYSAKQKKLDPETLAKIRANKEYIDGLYRDLEEDFPEG